MDKSLLMYRAGVRSTKKTLADGQEHELHYKAATPSAVALFVAANTRANGKTDDESVAAWHKRQAEFIAAHLCNEDGTPLMTVAEAELVPATLKPELCWLIVQGSNEAGEAGKG